MQEKTRDLNRFILMYNLFSIPRVRYRQYMRIGTRKEIRPSFLARIGKLAGKEENNLHMNSQGTPPSAYEQKALKLKLVI